MSVNNKVCNTILEAMGNTPMIRLNRMVDADSADVLVKFEGLNVGGSIKTRTAFCMIEAAEEQGLIQPDTIIVEPTSGNQGVGIALVAAVKGYKSIIVMPDSVSEERRKLVQNYGAEVILIHDDGDIGACIAECAATAERMAQENPKVYVPQQFENPANVMAHHTQTAREILAQTEGIVIDGYCSGIGTGGNIQVVEVPGANGGLHTNYEGKMQAAVKAVAEDDYDFVYIHVEAPDEMGHQGSVERKIQAIEYLDERIIAPMVKNLKEKGIDFRMMILPDHPTPIRVRTHTADDVPYFL